MSENEVLKAWTLNETANIQNLALSNNICFLIDFENAHDNYLGKLIMREKIGQNHYNLWNPMCERIHLLWLLLSLQLDCFLVV